MQPTKWLARQLLVGAARFSAIALAWSSHPFDWPSLVIADEASTTAVQSDEEIYGKFAIGPKTPTPLNRAVESLNKVLVAHPSQAAVIPLTVEEVVAVIRAWDRSKKPVADGTWALYEKIAETKTLPPHSLLELNDQWFERDKHEQRVLQIKLEAMTGKNQGDGFVIREHELERRPIPRPGYRWIDGPKPRDAANGWLSWYDNDVTVAIDDDDPDGLIVTVNRSYDVLGLQVVALDRDEKRYDLACRAQGAYGKFLTEQFRLDYTELPREKIKYLGIEAVTRSDLDRNSRGSALRPKRAEDRSAALAASRTDLRLLVHCGWQSS